MNARRIIGHRAQEADRLLSAKSGHFGGAANVLFPPIAVITFAATIWGMPVAKPPIAPERPAPLGTDESEFIKRTVKQFYGKDAVVRNFGPNPARLEIHVETDIDPSMEKYDCLGVLMTRIEREQISLEVSKRGRRIRGSAKLAYRQGVIL